jgi:hypothetical protein
MTKAMQQLLERVAAMPEDEQEQVARRFLEELDEDARWDALLAESKDVLREMAEDARSEFEAGLTVPLDPESL